MPSVEQRLSEMGIVLPKPWVLPPGITIPASLVRVRGKRVLVSGHVPLDAEGAVAGPFGRVGAELSAEQGQQAARAVLLAILASLKQKLGDLDRIGAWLRVYGMVCAAPGFTAFPGHRQLSGRPACNNGTGQVGGRDGTARHSQLRRPSLPGRDHQPRRLALLPLSPEPAQCG